MQMRALGQTGLQVSALGLGTAGLGAREISEADFSRVLHVALDRGVNLIDTARSYGLAEKRLGRHLGGRRKDVLLCTKGGYGVEGAPDWTAEAVTYGIHRALRELRTEVIDVFMLHACPEPILRRGDLQEALEQARTAGKIREAGYSGEGDALSFAVSSGQFGVVECSVNLVDQRNLMGLLAEAERRGLGVLAKRPLANACFTHVSAPAANDVAIYWGRLQRLAIEPGADGWLELALRFAAHAAHVHSAVVGCRSTAHLEEDLRVLERGPLPSETTAMLRRAFEAVGGGWEGLI